MQTLIVSSIKQTREMMTTDNITPKNQQVVVAIINNILTTQDKLNTIDVIVKQITADGKIDINDFPCFVKLFLESVSLIQTQVKVGSQVDTVNLKYICFCVLIFCIGKTNPTLLDCVDKVELQSHFDSLWQLVVLSIHTVSGGGCC